MSCVHYKFSSKLNYDTVTFDGLHISLCDLKRQIMAREKLKAADCDLQITNAQTKEGAWGAGARPAPGGGGRAERGGTQPGSRGLAGGRCPDSSVRGEARGGCAVGGPAWRPYKFWGRGVLPTLLAQTVRERGRAAARGKLARFI